MATREYVNEVYPNPAIFGEVKIYTREVDVRLLFNGLYKTLEGVYMEVKLPDGSIVQIYIPYGFLTDFDSSGCAKGLIDWMSMKYAALAHDWLYESGLMSRRVADLVFLIVAQAGEEKWHRRIRAKVAYGVITIGGGRAYRRYRKGQTVRNNNIDQLKAISLKKLKQFNLGYLHVE